MDYSALERLCRYVEAPRNQLRELSISNNQLAGVSKFSSGQRNEHGIRRLLTALGDASCKLTSLDMSANGLCDSDAASVLAVAVRPESLIARLRLHQWWVPVQQLSSDDALDLRAQRIDDADATLLARLLRARSALTRLDLSGNKLNAVGAAAIAQALVESGTAWGFHVICTRRPAVTPRCPSWCPLSGRFPVSWAPRVSEVAQFPSPGPAPQESQESP